MSDSFFKIRNKKTAVFLICLGISAFFWLLIKLSAEYEVQMDIPIKYTDFPNGQTLINKADSIILIKIRDNGFDLLGTGLFSFRNEMSLSIADMKTLHRNSVKNKSFILTKNLYNRIEEQFSSANQISIIGPDSLVLEFEKQSSKKLKIVAQTKIQLSPQFQMKSTQVLSPDSIVVYGSADDLKLIDSILTQEKIFNNVSSPISTELQLMIPKHLQSDRHSTQVLVEVEKFTEASIKVPIDISFAQQQNIRIFPHSVQIKYAVSFEKFNDINPDSFQVIAQIDPIEIGKLDFILRDYPQGIRIIDYSPKMGEFIIIK